METTHYAEQLKKYFLNLENVRITSTLQNPQNSKGLTKMTVIQIPITAELGCI